MIHSGAAVDSVGRRLEHRETAWEEFACIGGRVRGCGLAAPLVEPLGYELQLCKGRQAGMSRIACD